MWSCCERDELKYRINKRMHNKKKVKFQAINLVKIPLNFDQFSA